jgi:glycosyltransferase involved in cell wall biosynthesis
MRYNRGVTRSAPLSQASQVRPGEPRLLVLVGPPDDIPCGIRDYVRRLGEAFADDRNLQVTDYTGAWLLAPENQNRHGASSSAVTPKSAQERPVDLLVHYERSRVPSSDYLAELAQALRTRGDSSRLFVVPHEVYARDPYAFDIEALTGPRPLRALKRALYWWRHRPWYREIALQQAGYHAHGIFALNGVAAQILRERQASSSRPILVLVIPHARLEAWHNQPVTAKAPGEAPGETLTSPAVNRPEGLTWLWGLTGFLSASNDYASVFAALRDLPQHGLVLYGGTSPAQAALKSHLENEIKTLGLASRIFWHGYVPESQWQAAFAKVDGFVAPWKFRSATGSLFMALATGKPTLVTDLPLAREMLTQGAGIVTVGENRWAETLSAVAEGRISCPRDQYPWSYAAVARAYRDAINNSG